ncbi:MAG: phosphoribosylamine--glycine ligase [Bacteroidales bacterium]|nr:phosphoribosylamine--glycine ligase [Bacteroidales bacterium]
MYKILLLGSGGREHCLAWKIAQSSKVEKLFIAPGNAGTAACGTNVNLSPLDFEAIRTFVLSEKINMVVPGAEEPLVKGLHDFFLEDKELNSIPVIGPVASGARLEGSKSYAKSFMKKYKIPSAFYKSFNRNNTNDFKPFLMSIKPPYVLKADGLAAGKGVVICKDLSEACDCFNEMIFNEKFGEAGKEVVVEQFLEGIELSVFIITDGKNYKILPAAKDYKKIGEGDTGLNTGGMGSVSGVPFADKALMDKIEQSIILPTIRGLQAENINYKGFLYFGLINVEGTPYVIEYNSRLGDPEAQSVIPRIKSDFIDLFEAVIFNNINEKNIEIDDRFATSVILVSQGYPGVYEKGKIISGLDAVKDSLVFHSGTAIDGDKIITSGGRVLALTSFGKTIKEALNKSYNNALKIDYENKYYRKDLGNDLIYLSNL